MSDIANLFSSTLSPVSPFAGAPPQYDYEALKNYLQETAKGRDIKKLIQTQWKKITTLRSARGSIYDKESVMHYL